MQRVAITGGPAVRIATTDGQPRGATWGPDGTIVFATFAPGTGLQRVSHLGGEPTVLTRPDRERGERDHWWPEFLPGGEAVLFTIASGAGGIENHRHRGAGSADRQVEGAYQGRKSRAVCERPAILSTVSAGRCAPSPSTSDVWRLSLLLYPCSKE